MIRLLLVFLWLPMNLMWAEETKKPTQVTTTLEIPSRITYEINGYNLGSNLLSYARGKWLSMHYNIPLMYKPFPFANQFALHSVEKKSFNPQLLPEFKIVHPVKNELEICFEDPSSILYVIPCYDEPEDALDEEVPFIEVDWKSKHFYKSLKKLLKPENSITNLTFPNQRISIAVYMPDVSSEENASPLRNPPDSYYIEQIIKLSGLLYHRPLFVYLFTENRNAEEVLNRFKQAISLHNILFEGKKSNRMTRNSYVEDFINMGKFDCLVRPNCNLGFLLDQVNDYLISIRPTHYTNVNDVIKIDQTFVKTRKK